MKDVLVLGGTNNLGIPLVEKLVNKYNVYIANRGTKNSQQYKEIEYIIVDRFDKDGMREAFRGKYYDVIFDNSACTSNNVQFLLNNAQCGRYVALSTIMVTKPIKENITESDYNPYLGEMVWTDNLEDYADAKRLMERAIFQAYPDCNPVCIRVPYVIDERILWIVRHIQNKRPLNLQHLDRKVAIVDAETVCDFQLWLSKSNYVGAINCPCDGSITIRKMVECIEGEIGKKLINHPEGDRFPFELPSFCMDMKEVNKLGYTPTKVGINFNKKIKKYLERKGLMEKTE